VLDLDLAYGFQIYSDEDPATHALGLTIAVGLAENWAVFVDYRHVFTEITARHKQVRTRLQRYPMSLGVRFRWPLAEFEVGADLAATLNYVALETSAPGLDVNPDQRDLVFSVSPLLRASYCVVSRLRVFLSAGAEIFVNRRTYGVAGSTGREVLLDPWPVRPRLLAGVTADLF